MQGDHATCARAPAKSLDTAIQVFELVYRAYNLFISRDARDRRVLLEGRLSNAVMKEGRITGTHRKPFDFLAEIAESEKDEGDMAERISNVLARPAGVDERAGAGVKGGFCALRAVGAGTVRVAQRGTTRARRPGISAL